MGARGPKPPGPRGGAVPRCGGPSPGGPQHVGYCGGQSTRCGRVRPPGAVLRGRGFHRRARQLSKEDHTVSTSASPPPSDPSAAPAAMGGETRRGSRRNGNGKLEVSTSGLRIERRFTKAGIHPYDEVRWEQRTASIANEKGELGFEIG